VAPWVLVACIVLTSCALAITTVLLVAHWRFAVVLVTGMSMEPSFRQGDRLIVRRGDAGKIRVGTVVVMRTRGSDRPPGLPGAAPPSAQPDLAVKRVAALPGDAVPESVRERTPGASTVPEGMVVLLADHPAGADSRVWGFVPAKQILGPVIFKLSRRAEVGGSACPTR
jgi:signal peptidase I